MLIELGHAALAAAFGAALLQAISLWPRLRLAGVATGAAWAQFAALGVSFLALVGAFLGSDFSAELVASNSHTIKPLIYKASAAWGNHEGSMLLWTLVLAAYGAFLARDAKLDPGLRRTAIGVAGALSLGAVLFLLIASNPFERLDPAPIEGRGLNPLLQDPALAIHPPILYSGYVGFAAPYAVAVAALGRRCVDRAAADAIIRWSLVPLGLLTLGIGLGAWWAYRELGWGGWWFWDPVENASLLPWLSGAAAAHLAMVWRRTGRLAGVTLMSVIMTFSLSVLGTFIVRSGVLTSVHSFAVDPLRGTLILAYLAAVAGVALAALLRHWPADEGAPLAPAPSREFVQLAGSGLLLTAAATVFFGTLYPLIAEGLLGQTISVGAPYFNQTATPIMGLAVILLALAPQTNWGQSGDLRGFARPALVALGGATFTAIAGVLFLGLRSAEAGALGLAAGPAFLLAGVLSRPERRRHAKMAMAHGGVALAAFGMVASAALSTETVVSVSPGDRIAFGGLILTFEGVERSRGVNYLRDRAEVRISSGDGDRDIARLTPERRWYPAGDMVTTEAAIRSTLLTDLYVTLGDLRSPGAADSDWALRVRRRPFISWIWAGLIIAFAGTVFRGARPIARRRRLPAAAGL